MSCIKVRDLFTDYPHCIRLSQKVDNKVLITFNARNEHDRIKFAQDLEESITENFLASFMYVIDVFL